MYAGLTIGKSSGKLAGTHQKIDRVARRRLTKIISRSYEFPNIKDILRFEGKNGPDGLKLKGSNADNPWHVINPQDSNDTALLEIINNHIFNLSEALLSKDMVRSSFEAAWLAHSIVDGLTPAHHYPLGSKIEEIWGKPREEIIGSRKERTLIKGDNFKDTLSKNWEYWGIGGVMNVHLTFEFGVASAIASEKFETAGPDEADLIRLDKVGYEVMFMEFVHKIYAMNIYEEYYKSGWTLDLAVKTREKLVPEIIKAVTLAWYQAILNVNKKHR